MLLYLMRYIFIMKVFQGILGTLLIDNVISQANYSFCAVVGLWTN